MLGLYSEIWQGFPLSWRISATALSLIFLGYSISPLALGSSLLFGVSQQEACKLQFAKELSHDFVRVQGGGSSSEAALQNWNVCLGSIPAHPGLMDEYRAAQQGRSSLFSKEVK